MNSVEDSLISCSNMFHCLGVDSKNELKRKVVLAAGIEKLVIFLREYLD